MAFTPIPNGVRIVHVGQAGVPTIVNTFGCENGGGSEIGSSLSDLAKTHGDAWRQHIVPLLFSGYSHQQTLAYSLEDQALAPGDAGYSSAVSGGGGGAAAPLNTAVVVAMKTAKRGRTYQGRAYLGCVPIGWVNWNGDEWTAEGISAVTAAFAAYKDAVDPTIGNNGRLAVCSKGSVMHGISPHVEPVTATLVRPMIGTQRGRLS